MSVDNWDALPGAVAGASFAGLKYRFCKMGTAAFTVIPATASTDQCVGVAYDDVAVVGESITVASEGVIKIEASAAIAAGAGIMCSPNGRAATYVLGAGVIKQGIALSAATAAGDIISMQFNPAFNV